MTSVLRFDRFSLDVTRSGVVGGCVWFDLARPFPGEKWYDLPVPVVAAWAAAVREAGSSLKTATEIVVPLSDGPFSVLVSADTAGALVVREGRGGEPDTRSSAGTATVLPGATVRVDLVAEARATAETCAWLAEWAAANGAHRGDVDLLRREHAALVARFGL